MITVTRLNKSQMVINADLIKTVESTPDTVITLENDEKFIVTEPPDQIIEKIVAFRRRLYAGLFSTDGKDIAQDLEKK